MKKVIFTLIAFMFCLGLSFAQVDPRQSPPPTSAAVGSSPVQAGNWIVGGSIGSLGYNFTTESFGLVLNPRAGYFLMDDLAVGLGVTVGLTTVPNFENIWSYGVTPFVRYYFPEGATATSRFFGEAEAGLAGSTEASDASFLAGLRLGYAHFISNNVAIEGTFGYTYSRANINTGAAVTGLAVGLGFQIYLPGRANR
ncbi:hypothetical protein KIH41_06005 [Litoribacter ruber]|uniref:hypothetical protein n=1 Tax=Litoribacter ruber TaxID=702568 RepID=UPI001BD93E59|nr:hypothetical protein [Litoribacter ruber]MBT0810831.1 hypothetical protein [Litoribacter ruber]